MDHVFDVTSENSSSDPRSCRLSLMCSSKLYDFIFHIYIYDALWVNFYINTRWQVSDLHFFFILHGDVQLFQQYLLKPGVLNRRNIPQHNKSYIWQTHSKHYPQWWKIESISPEIRNKTRVPTLTTSIRHSFGSVGHRNQGRKRSKRNLDRKRRSETLAVCRWHDPLHRKP